MCRDKLGLPKTKLFLLLRLLSLSPGVLEGLIFVVCALCDNKPLPEVFGMSCIKAFVLIWFFFSICFSFLLVIMSPYAHNVCKVYYGFDSVEEAMEQI